MTPVLDDLAAELGMSADVVRARLEGLPADAIAPNYLQQDTAGRVGANFAGHVKAGGIDFDAGPISNISTLQAILWRSTVDSSIVGEVEASLRSSDGMRQLSLSVDPAGQQTPGLNQNPALYLQRDGPLAGTGRLIARAGAANNDKVLNEDDGGTSFVQLGAVQKVVVRGPYSFGFNLPNASDADFTAAIDSIAGKSSWLVLGMADSTAGFQYPQAFSWAAQLISDTSMRIHASNRLGTGIAAIGTFRFVVLAFY